MTVRSFLAWESWLLLHLRRRRDSNSRRVLPLTRFPSGRTRPLCDASVGTVIAQNEKDGAWRGAVFSGRRELSAAGGRPGADGC